MNTDSRNEAAIAAVLLFGPTAVGKTRLVLDLFRDTAEVINADSSQVYRGMDVGTAKPTPELRAKIRHHLIDIRDPDESYSVGDFVRGADDALRDVVRRGLLPIVCGGTAFYFRNLMFGLPETPHSDRQVRDAVAGEASARGLAALFEELESTDPETARRIAPTDRYRILRAVEVFRATGRPLSSFALPSTQRPGFRFLALGLDRPRPELYRRIEARVDEMLAQGLEAEVRGLLARGYTFEDPGLKAIGYRELRGRFEGGAGADETAALIKRNSRRFAKRQLTFFRSLPNVQWFAPEDREGILHAVEQFMR